MEYIVITSGKHMPDSEDIKTFIGRVNEEISKGYEPLGGIAVRLGGVKGAYFLQAMVKRVQFTEAENESYRG